MKNSMSKLMDEMMGGNLSDGWKGLDADTKAWLIQCNIDNYRTTKRALQTTRQELEEVRKELDRWEEFALSLLGKREDPGYTIRESESKTPALDLSSQEET